MRARVRNRKTGVANGSALAVGAAALVLLAAGCVPSLRTDIHDPDPAAKIPALVAAVHHPADEELRALVDALDHDDAAVRLFAIESLERATGETYGFVPYDRPDRRSQAVDRWRAALGQRLETSASGVAEFRAQEEQP